MGLVAELINEETTILEGTTEEILLQGLIINWHEMFTLKHGYNRKDNTEAVLNRLQRNTMTLLTLFDKDMVRKYSDEILKGQCDENRK